MLLIFNPDTDYALASGYPFYTPPAAVAQLRRAQALFPVRYTQPGDTIVCIDKDWDQGSPLVIEARSNKVGIVTLDKASEALAGDADKCILPWGWNHSLRQSLHDSAIPDCLLPSVADIDSLRNLSHRRLTIDFNRAMAELMPRLTDDSIPVEINNEDDAVMFWRQNPGCYFKAPWSSSGRGVMSTTGLDEKHVRPWCRGIIKRQGSVMAESGVRRRLDFATEWIVKDGQAECVGLSIFNTSPRGKYLNNVHGSNRQLETDIERHLLNTGLSLGSLTDAQSQVIACLLAPRYSGPLGIDMLIGADNEVRPCIELNLRMTMGFVYSTDAIAKLRESMRSRRTV